MANRGDVLRKVGTRLVDLISDADRPDAPAASGAAAGAEGGLVLSREEFERHLKGMARPEAPAAPLAGRVNFIGLSKIREKLGDRWGRVAERADDITRRAIERRLTAVDVYTRYRELHYLIVFANLPREQAQLKCALIAEEITKRLLGEDLAPDLLEVKTMISPLGDAVEFEDVPQIESLAARLAEGDSAEAAEPGPRTAAPPDEDDIWWEAQPQATAELLSDVAFVYRPMWDVRHKAVTTYACTPIPGPRGPQLHVADPSVLRRLDALVQRRVITDLRKLVKANRRMMLTLPVHFETLAAVASRNEYIELCRRGISPEGGRLLVFELVSIPDGLPQSRLLDLSAILRRFGRSVLMRTPVARTMFRPASETGIAAVGIEAPGDSVPEARQMQDMERFAAAARRAGLTTYVHGLQTISLTTAAIAAGFDFIDGDILTSVVDRPQNVYSFEMAQLFRTRLRSRAAAVRP